MAAPVPPPGIDEAAPMPHQITQTKSPKTAPGIQHHKIEKLDWKKKDKQEEQEERLQTRKLIA